MRSPLKLSLRMGADRRAARAKTSQATPTSQPLDLSQSRAQISIYFFKPGNVFSMCVRTRLDVRVFVIFSQVQRSHLHQGEVWSLRSAGHIVFIPLPMSSIWQMTEASEGCGAEQPDSSVTASYQRCLAAQQMDEGNRCTGETLPSRLLQIKHGSQCWKGGEIRRGNGFDAAQNTNSN